VRLTIPQPDARAESGKTVQDSAFGEYQHSSGGHVICRELQEPGYLHSRICRDRAANEPDAVRSRRRIPSAARTTRTACLERHSRTQRRRGFGRRVYRRQGGRLDTSPLSNAGDCSHGSRAPGAHNRNHSRDIRKQHGHLRRPIPAHQ
jgi:hypothetical protein